MNKTILGLLGVVLLFGFMVVGKYNSLKTMSIGVDAQWAQVDTVLQRRFDSVEQAIGALKISNKNEQDALQKITDARRIYTAASGDVPAQIAAANNYNGALNGLLLSRGINGENYANLKTPELVGGLMGGVNIEGNENRIAVERGRYNDKVKDYNTAIAVFPGNISAMIFGFAPKEYFNITDEAAKKAPEIGKDLNF
jgi:LemA protein